MLQCRRCYSFRLITLNKKSPQDNDVLRCQECGFLFSPAAGGRPQPRDGAPGRCNAGLLDAEANGNLASAEGWPRDEGC